MAGELDPTAVRLGKLAPAEDKRNLQLVRYLTPIGLGTPPISVDYTSKVVEYPMYKNDELGDCTCAAASHLVQIFGALEGKNETPSEAETVSLYKRISPKDQGATCLSALKAWQKVGLANEKPFAFTEVSIKNIAHIKSAISLFGGIYVGVNLPTSAQDQVGGIWKSGSGVDSAPGSWGGHAISISSYDLSTLTCITWGTSQKMTWKFFRRYADEAFAIIPSTWQANKAGKPTGIDMASLNADLRLL